MALYKEIELNSGVTVAYHRIVSVNVITNVQNVIEVASYVSKEKRAEEQEAINGGNSMDVFINTEFFSAPYNQFMTVSEAYNYMKTLPEFAGATDILEN